MFVYVLLDTFAGQKKRIYLGPMLNAFVDFLTGGSLT